MSKQLVCNLFAGPGAGKSTIATGVFSRLKMAGINCEYVPEYAKDLAWKYTNPDGTKVPVDEFSHQEYIFAKQLTRMRRVQHKVDVIITDSPLLLGCVYTPRDFELPSLRPMIVEAHKMFSNVNLFLNREKKYNPRGRNQTEEEAIALDQKIRDMLTENQMEFSEVPGNKQSIKDIAKMLIQLV